MKSIVNSIPGYRINEYMIVLHPPQELRERISGLKKEFAQKYETSALSAGKSHIMLAGFSQYAMMEERVLNRLKMLAMGFRPFRVDIKDYGSQPTHSIHLNVVTREPVKNLVREIKNFQQLLRINTELKPYFPDEPMITIARKLLPWQYEKGWLEYSHRRFTGRFIADSMLLVKRRQGEKAWQILSRLEFKNLPVSTKQGELFP